ncbi:hypothetical protein RA2_03602 [Roseovarius sp. A-2]|uniref:hypothetical protein n=1 Tax=Roseovarius sp. A-2 TaxID=1570360 RepID=UPI0009B503B5|nr:hypothetical protein [Roseovarius sp. A-2]GAW36530.1 hypothetical protein RA2_03602 [Roseovarius sp. A-2]
MKSKIAVGLFALALAAGCGGNDNVVIDGKEYKPGESFTRNGVTYTVADGSKSKRPRPVDQDVWKTRETVTYGQNDYYVAVNADRTTAYVQATSRDVPHSLNDLSAAVREATGCQGSLGAGALVALGIDNDTDISQMGSATGKPQKIWSVPLSC